MIFVFLLYLLHTTGIVPIARRSQRDEPSGAELHGLADHGAWFYMTAVGNFVAGKIGEATGGEGGEMTKDLTLGIYNKIGWVAIGVGVAVLLVSPFIKRLMHLDTLEDEDLAGRGELAEPQGAGIHPDQETVPRPAN